MLSRIFNQDNAFFSFCGKLADVFMLSLLWIICCLPLITIGSSTAALYNTIVKCIRGKQDHPYSTFIECLKKNFKDGIPISFSIIAILFIMSYQFIYLWNGAIAGFRVSFLFLIFNCVFSIIPFGFICWICPIFSRYEFTFSQLAVTSFKFVFAHLFSSIIMAVIFAVSLYFSSMLIFPIIFVPFIVTYINSIFIEKAFKKHQ